MHTQKAGATEKQQTHHPQITREHSTGGTATLVDNRPTTVLQRRLRESRASSDATPRMPRGSARFQQIATAMGASYGVDTSSLKATHNSSFPATVNAAATIQGRNIHFAPGMDTDYNIKHEVAHAIDNTLYGTPSGDKTVQGRRVDTTRERMVDKMVQKPVNQQRTSAHVSNPPLAHHQDVTQYTATSKVVQRNEKNNQEAFKSKDLDYVHIHAQSSWEQVMKQYHRGELHHSEHPNKDKREEPHGMKVLLDNRQKVKEILLENRKNAAQSKEKEVRKEKMNSILQDI